MARPTIVLKSGGTDAPAAHLAAAQADAERHCGRGPVSAWRPSSDGRLQLAAWAAIALLAMATGWWLGSSDAPQPTVAASAPAATRQRTALSRHAPMSAVIPDGATGASLPTTSRAAPRPAPDGDPARVAPLPDSVAVPAQAPSPADADAAALHPEPGPVEARDGFVANVNTPTAPDENDATPGEDSPPDEPPDAPSDE